MIIIQDEDEVIYKEKLNIEPKTDKKEKSEYFIDNIKVS